MAIVKITDAEISGPSVFVQPMLNQMQALIADRGHGPRSDDEYILKGALFSINNELYRADSDTKINGTRFVSLFIKFTVSGNIATPSFVDVLQSELTWDGAKQGWYDASDNYYYKGITSIGNSETAYGLFNSTSFKVGSVSFTVPVTGTYKVMLAATSYTSDYSTEAGAGIDSVEFGGTVNSTAQTFTYISVGQTHLVVGQVLEVYGRWVQEETPGFYFGAASAYLEPVE